MTEQLLIPLSDPSVAALPAEPVATQIEAARRVTPHLQAMKWEIVVELARRGAYGMTAKDVAYACAMEIVTVRARLTEYHQRGLIVRTTMRREGQYVYVTASNWHAKLGSLPSRPHHGRLK